MRAREPRAFTRYESIEASKSLFMLYYIASSASFRSKEAQASQLSSCTRLCTFSSLILLAALTFAACGRVGVLQQCVRPKVLTHVL